MNILPKFRYETPPPSFLSPSVFKIPPRSTSGGYKCGEWLQSDKIWPGRLRVVSCKDRCEIRLEDPNSGDLFADCFVNPGQRENVVESVLDSSRYFVSCKDRCEIRQEGGFDLDMTYISKNIITMEFPAGDMSSSFFGYVEGFYRNHMEEVIKFFETHHKDKYKVYNLCSERLYDASLFEGKVASFPFDDHNCPPIQLIISFCQWETVFESFEQADPSTTQLKTAPMTCLTILGIKFLCYVYGRQGTKL